MNGTQLLAPTRRTRVLIGVVVGTFVMLPLLATFEYTLRDGDTHSLVHWLDVIRPANAAAYQPIWVGLRNSLTLTVATVAIVLLLLAPTMLLVNLRYPRLTRALEYVSLLTLSIPAIVLVVGLAPIYLVIGRTLGTGAWTLAFAYGILVLPFAMRPLQAQIDAVDVVTLSEAARSLGAGWVQVIVRVLLPNLRSGLLNASLITVAVVLGEFTVASLLNRQNLQTALVLVNRQDGYIAVVFTLLALAFCFLLLLIIGRSGRAGASKE